MNKEYQTQLHSFLTNVFSKLGFDPTALHSLGNDGQFGIAYLSGDDTVIKVTSEVADAELCNRIKGKYFKTICDVFGVYKLQSEKYEITNNNFYKYALVKEYAHSLTNKEKDQFFKTSNIFRKFNRTKKEYWLEEDFINKFINECQVNKIEPAFSKWFIDCTSEMLHNNIWIKDIHQDNIGKRTDGSYILFDLGLSTGGVGLKNNAEIQINEVYLDESNINELYDKNNYFSKKEYNDYFLEVFQKLGYNYSKAIILGQGLFGIAFKLDNIVIKFTSEYTDAEISNKLIDGSMNEFVCDIYKVYKLETKKYSNLIDKTDFYPYVIIKEYIPDAPYYIKEEFNNLNNYSDKLSKYIKEENYDDYELFCITFQINKNIADWFIKFKLACEKNNIWLGDITGNNVGIRNGNYVLFDLGCSNGGCRLQPQHDLEINETIDLDEGSEINELTRLKPKEQLDYTEIYNKVINKLGYTDTKLNYLDKGKNGVVYTMNSGGKTYTVKFTTDKSDADLCNKIKGKNLNKFCKVYNVNKIIGGGINYDYYVIIKEYVSQLTSQEYKDFSDGYLEFLIFHGLSGIDKINDAVDEFIASCRESKVKDYVIDWYLEIVTEMRANGFFTKDVGAYNIGKNSSGKYVVFDMGISKGGEELNKSHELEINEYAGSAVNDIENQNVDEFMFDESQHVSIPAGEKNLYYNQEENEYFKDVITKLGYDYTKVHFIGSGSNGIAFKLDNTVIKFTSSRDDAETSYKLINNHSFDKFVCKIYAVYKIDTKKYKVTYNNGPYVIIKEYVPPLNSAYEISFSRLRKLPELHYLYDSKIYYKDNQNVYKKYYNKFIKDVKKERIKSQVVNWYLELLDVMIKNNIYISDINYTNVGSRANGSFAIFDIGSSEGGEELNKSHNLKI